MIKFVPFFCSSLLNCCCKSDTTVKITSLTNKTGDVVTLRRVQENFVAMEKQ
jgi:hypothetical protein